VKGRSALRIRLGRRRLLPVVFAALSFAALAAPPATANEKYAAMVVDANSGKTLFARHADAQRFPASLTKMMTLYIVFEELDAKRISLSTKFSVSANASRQAPSKLGLKPGSSIAVEDAILALVTKSANDVAVVVAENIGGSVSDFAGRMTRTARALGMRNTVFRNPHGLPNAEQHTTAHDLVRLATALQDRFPKYYPYFGRKSFAYRGARYRNHNHLLGSVAGVDGIKTGYTRASGFNLVTNVERDGRHVIAVVMGGKTASSRDAHMRELISKYLPKASTGRRTTPLLIADTGAVGLERARLPRSRPDGSPDGGDETVLAYAAAPEPTDLVSRAIAEANDAQADVGEEPEADPIAHRIEVASSVAAFADINYGEGDADPIGRIAELARIRAGVSDIVAAPARAGAATSAASDEAGWHIQIGAVPTAEGASRLLDKAQASMGSVLASLQPVTQELDRDGETLYRARFAGFSDKEEARATCAKLKRKNFACLAVPN
jgi:D-alanyl-D-alanine carboxypeptidase